MSSFMTVAIGGLFLQLLKQVIESFPEKPWETPDLMVEAIALAEAITAAMIDNQPFYQMSEQLREFYFGHGMQRWAWLNAARCFIQVGYRLHSLELTESMMQRGMTECARRPRATSSLPRG